MDRIGRFFLALRQIAARAFWFALPAKVNRFGAGATFACRVAKHAAPAQASGQRGMSRSTLITGDSRLRALRTRLSMLSLLQFVAKSAVGAIPRLPELLGLHFRITIFLSVGSS